MALIYDSSHSGQEIDAAVDAVQTTIPSQLTQIGSKLDKTEEKVDKLATFQSVTPTMNSGGYVHSTENKIISSSGWVYSEPFSVQKGTILTFVGGGKNNVAAISIYNNGIYNSLKAYSATGSTAVVEQIFCFIKEDCQIVISSTAIRYGGKVEFITMKDGIFSSVADNIVTSTYFDVKDVTPSYERTSGYINGSTVVSNSSYIYTSPIEVKKFDKIIFTGAGLTTVNAISLYKDGVYSAIIRYAQGGSEELVEYTIEEDCSIVISSLGKSFKFFRIYRNDGLTDINKIGTDSDGNKVFSSDVLTVVTDNNEYIYAIADKDNTLLFGIQKDGNIVFGAGVPQQIKDAIMNIDIDINSGELAETIASINTEIAKIAPLQNRVTSLENSVTELDGLAADVANAMSASSSAQSDAASALAVARQIQEEGRYDISGNVTNNPDEEDLTANGGVLKLKDKVYAPSLQSGYGRVMLRRGSTSTLTQSMFQSANTIYYIQYDFEIGEPITMPANCTLVFIGGKMSNGTLILDRTTVIAHERDFIFDNVNVQGSASGECYADWFGAMRYNTPTTTTGNSARIQKAFDSPFKTVRFGTGYYYIDITLNLSEPKTYRLDGGFTSGISAYRTSLQQTIPEGTVLWTDKSINVIDVKIAARHTDGYETLSFYLLGGTIDVSPCKYYSANVVTITRSSRVNCYPYITTSLIGSSSHVITDGAKNICQGNGIVFMESGDSGAGAIYGGQISANISRFYCGVKNAIVSGTWITNVQFHCEIDGCIYAYDFGTIGNSGGSVTGWIQPATFFNSKENGVPVITGKLKGIYIGCKVWDLNLMATNGWCTNQYFFIADSLEAERPIIGMTNIELLSKIGGYYENVIKPIAAFSVPVVTGSTRPQHPYQGMQCYDKTLNIPIWYNGTDWVNSNGVTV